MKPEETFSRDIGRIFFWYGVRYLLKWTPPLFDFFIYKTIGDLHYLTAKKSTSQIRRNIKNIFPELSSKQLERIVNKYIQNHYMDRFIIFTFKKLSLKNIEKFHRIRGIEVLESALRKGKGAILLHAHTGLSQFPLFHLGSLGYKIVQIGFRSRDDMTPLAKRLTRVRISYESSIPAKMVYIGNFMRPIFDALMNNEIVMTGGDGPGNLKVNQKTFIGELFGKPFKFPEGPFKLSVMMESPLIPMFTTRVDTHRYCSDILKPFELPSDLSKEDKISFLKREYISLLERTIRSNIEDWHYWDQFFEGGLIVRDTSDGGRG